MAAPECPARAGGVVACLQWPGRTRGRDLIAASRWADDAVSVATGLHLMVASMTRARVAITQREFEQAECDAHEAVACAAVTGAPLFTPDVLECLAHWAGEDGSHREAARLFGAAEALRAVWARCGSKSTTRDMKHRWRRCETRWRGRVRIRVGRGRGPVHRGGDRLRAGGRGEGKRPASSWVSLTPAECEVVRLVCEGLAN
jgi:hypothetical protein